MFGDNFILTYTFADHPLNAYPHFLEAEPTNSQSRSMARPEYNALLALVKEHCYPADYLSDTTCCTVSFRYKADAMRIKLMWKPIVWHKLVP